MSAEEQAKDPVGDDALRSIALLEATHTFPVDYAISVISFHVETITLEVRKAASQGAGGEIPDHAHQILPSGGGKYASHRLRVLCHTPQDVLDLYNRMRAVKGVVTVL